MKNSILQELNVIYEPGQREHWTGRKTNPAIGIQYWHQAIEFGDIRNYKFENKPTIAFIGYQCDEGVRRNFGRIGSAFGPQLIKDKLAKLPIHFDSKKLVDFGNVICIKEDMESCQIAFSKLISQLISQHIFPVGFGGGHDMAFAHFMGIYDVVSKTTKPKIGVINFDAHFDLRPEMGKPNSGTSFYQIIETLKKTNTSFDYFVIGIQQQSNTKELFEIAKNEKVEFITNFECEFLDNENQIVLQKLNSFINKNDHLYITIDLDGFSSAYAPGVSAPSPLGYSPNFIFKMLRFLFQSNKVISCDIAELNPKVDVDNITANLAAKLVDFIASIR